MVLCACNPEITGNIGMQPDMFPDYREVTVPANIAPLNFEVSSDQGSIWMAVVTAGDMEVRVRSADGLISFGKGQWKRLLSSGENIRVQILEKRKGEWLAYEPFDMYVAEEIDAYMRGIM